MIQEIEKAAASAGHFYRDMASDEMLSTASRDQLVTFARMLAMHADINLQAHKNTVALLHEVCELGKSWVENSRTLIAAMRSMASMMDKASAVSGPRGRAFRKETFELIRRSLHERAAIGVPEEDGLPDLSAYPRMN